MVDLVVRTKSHLATRLSGYLLRWIAYAELYFTPVLFPDFDVEQLQKALDWFEEVKEHRNFGK
jgi:undecaprenyl diphosphate synthase